MDIKASKSTLENIMSILNHRELDPHELVELSGGIDNLLRISNMNHVEVMQELSAIKTRAQNLEDMILKFMDSAALSGQEEIVRRSYLEELRRPERDVTMTAITLGQGGFGSVVLGSYMSYNVAIKKVLHADSSNRDGVENEILLMKYIGNCPNILTCFGFFYTNRGRDMNIILELSPYGSLAELLDNKTNFPHLPDVLLLGFLLNLAAALDYIHKKRIKHKDIKPANLLMFPKMTLKLCDFGLARQHSSLQQSSTAAGTVGFMAPEILSQQSSRLSSDIFSFGMVAAQLFSRRAPTHSPPALKQLEEALAPKLHLSWMQTLRALLLECVLYKANEDPDGYRPDAEEVYRRIKNVIAERGVVSSEERALVGRIETTLEPKYISNIVGAADTDIPLENPSVGFFSSSSSSTVVLLQDLTVQNVVTLLTNLNFPGCDKVVLDNRIDGRTLNYINTINALDEFRLPIIQLAKKENFLGILKDLKDNGVRQELLVGEKSYQVVYYHL